MKINKSLLIAAISLLSVSGLMAKQQPKKDEIPGVSAQPTEFFYTGKPYDADLGAYTFKNRNYDPHIKRWTSADPSGFPDGANNQIYVSAPTYCLDIAGLYSYQYVTGNFYTTATVSYTTKWFQSFSAIANYDYFTGPSGISYIATEGWMQTGASVDTNNAGPGMQISGASASGKTFQWLQDYYDSGLSSSLTSTSADGLTKSYLVTWNYSYTIVFE